MPGQNAVDREDLRTDREDLRLDDAVTADERPIEAPPEDAYEQATPADPRGESAEPSDRLEVNEYDAVEQATVLHPDDEYDH